MTTMSIKTFIRVAKRLPVTTSVLLRGNHGIGKSQVVRQVSEKIAEEQGISDYEVIDRRLSQMTEGDMVGLPSTDGNVTRFNPPDWYALACKKPVVLLLDELNRATPEVMQAAFQIVLDRELNGWKLHELTRVYAAINSDAAYNVNEVDPALLDRFWAVDLKPDFEDFKDWAQRPNPRKQHEFNCAPVVLDFLANQDKWLDPPKNSDPQQINPSRRSWERLGDALAGAGLLDTPNEPDFYSLCLGYVGTEATIAFVEFAKSVDNRLTGEDILDNWKKVAAPKIKRLGQERLNIAIEKVSDYAIKLGKLSEKQQKNLTSFGEILPHELRIVLWNNLVKHGVDKIQLAKDVHKSIAHLVMEVFGVPMGEAGIGVTPNIPGILQKKQDDKDK